MSVTFAAEHAPEHLQINMSNTNAFRVCEALGIDLAADGWVGDMPAEAFLGRVLLALALQPDDAGVPSTESQEPGGPRVIEGGRRAGYIQERLQQLHALAVHATEVYSEVWWM